MPRIKSLIAVLLLALWLPATAHCALESVGILVGSEGCCPEGGVDCAGDKCEQLEKGLFKNSSDTVKVTAPQQLLCTCYLCLQLIQPELVAVADLSAACADHPQDWIPSWNFEHRAALPALAPSAALA